MLFDCDDIGGGVFDDKFDVVTFKKHAVFALVVLVGRAWIFGDASGYRGLGFGG